MLMVLCLVTSRGKIAIYPSLADAYQLYRGGPRSNMAARAQRRAIQPRHGVRKIEDARHFPSRQQSVDERSVEDVARAGGVHSLDDEARRINELPLPEQQRAVRPERHADSRVAEFFGDAPKRAKMVRQPREGGYKTR